MQSHRNNVIAFPISTAKACRVPIPECRVTRAVLPESVAAMFARDSNAAPLLIIDSGLDSEGARIAASMTLAAAVGNPWAWTSTEDMDLARRQLVAI